MNLQPTIQSPLPVIRQPAAWRRRRVQQFADRSGLSRMIVEVLLQDKARALFFSREIDRLVDPELQTINEPI